MRESAGTSEGVRGRARASTHRGEGAQPRAMEVGHCCPTWWPCAHFNEQVAGDEVAGVGRIFGPVMSQIGPWAQKQS